MARVRFIGPEPVTVPELGDRAVELDEVIDVPDERFGGYVCQAGTWEPVAEPPDWVWPDASPEPEGQPESVQHAPAKKTTVKAAPKGVGD
ncbi:hypothetical protein [Streptomyces sp. NPDC023838]|uniref:hypothetical protein n=1 Tax=Streptomyces sp. NPDC023838 TaxID=3154325 RepID=UPI0033FAB072